ncbi:Mu transposase C-terminal domain-containing protein [Candidatus Nephthysia bennettiae]|uniref:DDE-type integrase/transposase/recombinase n=1 Tax=Candidatus Nephthysia bennettiae TaxID=3127016 RepID=A0A934N132_9BACT|nr:DDE-type integrase/transposase/recombinase [Candidatus Dormibacteraeota bacterium]
MHGSWCNDENTRAGQQVLRAALLRRGLPEQIYVDNGAPFANSALQRTCTLLGIHLIHSRPYSPEGRGKQERLNRVIRERFLLEAEAAGIRSLEELNDRFVAWTETYLNCRAHSETGQTDRSLPDSRCARRRRPPAPPRSLPLVLPAQGQPDRVSLLGNRYQVDSALVGRQVELRYDPEDLTRISVFFQGRPVGEATPFRLGRHVHPQVPQAARPEPEATGVDYLGLVLGSYEQATVDRIAYRNLDLDRQEQSR